MKIFVNYIREKTYEEYKYYVAHHRACLLWLCVFCLKKIHEYRAAGKKKKSKEFRKAMHFLMNYHFKMEIAKIKHDYEEPLQELHEKASRLKGYDLKYFFKTTHFFNKRKEAGIAFYKNLDNDENRFYFYRGRRFYNVVELPHLRFFNGPLTIPQKTGILKGFLKKPIFKTEDLIESYASGKLIKGDIRLIPVFHYVTTGDFVGLMVGIGRPLLRYSHYKDRWIWKYLVLNYLVYSFKKVAVIKKKCKRFYRNKYYTDRYLKILREETRKNAGYNIYLQLYFKKRLREIEREEREKDDKMFLEI